MSNFKHIIQNMNLLWMKSLEKVISLKKKIGTLIGKNLNLKKTMDRYNQTLTKK